MIVANFRCCPCNSKCIFIHDSLQPSTVVIQSGNHGPLAKVNVELVLEQKSELARILYRKEKERIAQHLENQLRLRNASCQRLVQVSIKIHCSFHSFISFHFEFFIQGKVCSLSGTDLHTSLLESKNYLHETSK